MYYHAHIYWQNENQRSAALTLRQPLQNLGCRLGTIHDTPIGPHPYAMYQVNYNSDIQESVEELLSTTKLDILLHEDTGDDLRDHTEGARWIGNKLILDLEWLENYVKERSNELS
jgi:DOPA 4,5-dioxygenase